MSEDLRSLYQRGLLEITDDNGKFIKWLDLSANMYKYSLGQSVQIYMQNDKAAAAAEKIIWEKCGRKVNDNAEGIKVLSNSRNVVELFDISQTEGRDFQAWKVQNEAELVEYANQKYNMSLKDMDDYIEAMTAYLVSTVDTKNPNELFLCVQYMSARRLGMPYDSRYININTLTEEQRKTLMRQTYCLGAKLLRKVEAEVKELGRVENAITSGRNRENQRIKKSEYETSQASQAYREPDKTQASKKPFRKRSNEIYAGESAEEIYSADGVGRTSAGADTDTGGSGENKGSSIPPAAKERGTGAEGGGRAEEDTADNYAVSGGGQYSDEGVYSDTALTEEVIDDLQRQLHEEITAEMKSKYGEQLDLFNADAEPVNSTKNEQQNSIPQQIVDEILTTGGNDSDSVLKICVQYSKQKTNNIDFLKNEYGTGGKGFLHDGSKVAVWWNNDGIRVAYGKRAIERGEIITWEQADERISELLSMGRFAPQETLDKMRDYEYSKAAGAFWYMRQNVNFDDYPDLRELFKDEWFNGGYPDSTARIIELLKNPQSREEFINTTSTLTEMYDDIPRIMRFRMYSPDKVLSQLQDLQLEHKIFNANEIQPTAPGFITEDELDQLFINHGSGISRGSIRTYLYFQEHSDLKERIDFLKNEYGTGGYASGVFDEWHDAKGISFSRSDIFTPYSKVNIPWNKAANRIDRLIKAGKYLTEKEIAENVPKYQSEQEQQRIRHEKYMYLHDMNNLSSEELRRTLPKRIQYFTDEISNYERNFFEQFGVSDLLDKSEIYIGDAIKDNDTRSNLISCMDKIKGATTDAVVRNCAASFVKELSEMKSKYEEQLDLQTEKHPDGVELHIGFSEHPVFYDREFNDRNTNLSFALGNRLLGVLDEKQHREREDESKQVGWYHKTDFTIKAVINGEAHTYEGRFDIGDGEGDLIAHIKNFYDYCLSPNCPYITEWKNGGEDYYRDQMETLRFGRDVFVPFMEQCADMTAEDKRVLTEIMESENEWFKPIEKGNLSNFTAYAVGDFYELYGEEAEKAAKLLDLYLTTHNGEPVLGLPKHAIERYSDRLSELGYSLKTREVNPHFDIESDVPAAEDKSVNHQNFVITDNNLGVGGAKEKFKRNIEAVKILKECEAAGRAASAEEQEALSQYVGWGGLADAFDKDKKNWAEEYEQLKAILTESEYKSAIKSTQTAFYTPPEVIKAIYQAIGNTGITVNSILEPACGTGNFMGMIPEKLEDAKMYGVELDSVSGRIAKMLYPNNNIQICGYEDTQFPDNFFDVAVGNVPFGQLSVNDRRYSNHKFMIHDYYFAKTIDKVRPGGIIAFITSKFTMDKKNSSVRKYIAQRADLLGAVRLPDNTFKANAGTEVTSDILFLQKRDRINSLEPDWVSLDTAENGIAMNSYFVNHPEMILGNMEMESSQYGMISACKAYKEQELSELLFTAVKGLSPAKTYSVAKHDTTEEEKMIPADLNVRNLTYTVIDGDFYYRENSYMRKVELSGKLKERIEGMHEIRNIVRDIIDMQTHGCTDDELKQAQKKLNDIYDNYVKKNGILNSQANKQAFKEDADLPLLMSLEITDDKQNVRKADMFFKRTIRQRKIVTSADNPKDALMLSMAEYAQINMEYMQQLTGQNEKELYQELEGLIYKNPLYDGENMRQPKYLTADEYLSGNVLKKLETVQELANENSEYRVNVQALKSVQPEPLEAVDIAFKLGLTWIEKEDYERFMYTLFQTPSYLQNDHCSSRGSILIEYNKYTNEWSIYNKNSHLSVITTGEFGTERRNSYEILEDSLNLRQSTVRDRIEDGDKVRYVINQKETIKAQEKQEQLREEFRNWILDTPDIREKYTEYYNRHYNNSRLRVYDGEYLSFPGMTPEIELRNHQRNAVARILYSDTNTLLAHTVGAGKTYEMVTAAMELKRLGLADKSMFVVPNHLIEQWGNEFLQLYPSANILVSSKKDFEKSNRQKFFSKIAMGEYDAVIVGHSQFEKIPLSNERLAHNLEEEIDRLSAAIEEMRGDDNVRLSVKQMERTKQNLEEKYKALLDNGRKDDIFSFENLGVDYLFVDEAHMYKNCMVTTKLQNVSGISVTPAQKSMDMLFKCKYISELQDGRGVVFATGTPISNSITEMYIMQRYLDNKSLIENGLEFFDSWAAMFGNVTSGLELAPEGTGYRMKSRLSKFDNLPELMNMFTHFADVQSSQMLKLPVPDHTVHNEVVEPDEFIAFEMMKYVERAAAIRSGTIDPSEDNMLKITNEARKLALDPQLIDPDAPQSRKIELCADNIYKEYTAANDIKGTQLVFCDLGTPQADEDSTYSRLINSLKLRGIPEDEIAVIHDANTDAKKSDMFAKVRAGIYRIMIGSTQKMGAGTNCQTRLTALHHIDCPWVRLEVA